MEEISYTVTKDDLAAWSTYYNLKTAKTKRKTWYGGWKGQLLGTIFFIVGIVTVIKTDLAVLSIILLFIGAFLFLQAKRSGSTPSYLTPFLKSALNKQGAKIYENAGPGLVGQITLRIEEDALLERTAVGEQKIKWDAVGPVITHENYVFVFVSGVGAAVINRNQVVTGNIDKFKEKVKEKALIKE